MFVVNYLDNVWIIIITFILLYYYQSKLHNSENAFFNTYLIITWRLRK